MIIASLILNTGVIVFFIIAFLVFRKEILKSKKPVKANIYIALRYYTVESNIFAALVSLCMVICNICVLSSSLDTIPMALINLKFVSTTCITLTFLVVVFYLLPRFGVQDMLSGSNFHMHLVTPLLSIFSFILCEGPVKIPYPYSFLNLIPVGAYGLLYLYKVVLTKNNEKRWDDMYLFNANGKWYIVMALMLIFTVLIGLLLLLIHNLVLAG